ncbi:protein boule-like isoform X2 [Stylophora pistillata]|uniref:Protein boule n=1 Tax=Stylophora pistillata TaxID=50429 RepID=A0A2B4SNY4_STYPI|nr:protein boule-like isoform X2 [Stylophora pistillata]PFX32384.1 Protein boule [Stylophora pistillata]
MENSSTYLFGKRFRNRLFVGGLPVNTTAHELANYFSNFGHVIETKIIFDENNVSKGYGFVTFASEKDVHNVTEMGTLFFRNKKLNLGPAVKKQGPMSPESPELVVVSTQMKGDFYYPVPSYTYSDSQLSPAPQYTYQHPCQVSYPHPHPHPRGYMYVYEEQPPLMFYQHQMPNVQNTPQAPNPRQKINKRLPPRMRRSREN